jgi:hypothetical protein
MGKEMVVENEGEKKRIDQINDNQSTTSHANHMCVGVQTDMSKNQNLVAFNALLAVQTFKFVLPQVFFLLLFITQLIIIYRYYDNDNDDVRPPPGITGTNEQGARDADTF